MYKTVCMSINICIWLLWIITMPRQENNPRNKNVTYVITKIWVIFLLTLKSATNSHADYYCCQDTLFDDSLATSDVIIYE